jgi:hypothetical protein
MNEDILEAKEGRKTLKGTALVPLILEQTRAVVADEINLPQTCQDDIQKSWLMRWLFRQAEQAYFCYPAGPKSQLNGALQQLRLEISDGDAAFA